MNCTAKVVGEAEPCCSRCKSAPTLPTARLRPDIAERFQKLLKALACYPLSQRERARVRENAHGFPRRQRVSPTGSAGIAPPDDGRCARSLGLEIPLRPRESVRSNDASW